VSGTAAEKFHGLTGLWKSVASFGVIGAFAALTMWLVLVTVPAEREAAREEIQLERAAARSETAKSREHGDRAVREIGDSMQALSWLIHDVLLRTQDPRDFIGPRQFSGKERK
jgi:hypothetical protein